jgi:hypothetical protein
VFIPVTFSNFTHHVVSVLIERTTAFRRATTFELSAERARIATRSII